MSAARSLNGTNHASQWLWNVPLHVAAFFYAYMGLIDTAFAYRPFDGTDAAVADPGEMEIELQPAGAKSSGGQKTIVAPATVLNYGFAKDWELVLETRAETPLSESGPTVWSDSGVFLKHVLRPGVLQDQAGPSIATEFGALLPDTIGSNHFGASVAAIISQRWDWGTAHLNIAGALTREQQDRKSTRLNSSHLGISYAVFCLKKKKVRLEAGTQEGHTNAVRSEHAHGRCASDLNSQDRRDIRELHIEKRLHNSLPVYGDFRKG